jgi:hypothetical protein
VKGKRGVVVSEWLAVGTVLLIALPPIAFIMAVIAFYFATSEED